MAEFIFCTVLCFQHILLNTIRRMNLKHEIYSLRGILFLMSNNTQVAAYVLYLSEVFTADTAVIS